MMMLMCTPMLLIAGFLVPDEGTVSIDGVVVAAGRLDDGGHQGDDGRFVAFQSDASNLVANQSGVTGALNRPLTAGMSTYATPITAGKYI